MARLSACASRSCTMTGTCPAPAPARADRAAPSAEAPAAGFAPSSNPARSRRWQRPSAPAPTREARPDCPPCRARSSRDASRRRRRRADTCPRQLHRAAGGLQITARVEDQPHAVFGHGGEQRLTVGVKRLVVVVRVGVKNQAHRMSFLFDRGDDPQQKGISQTAYSLAAEKPFAGSLTAWQQRLSGTRSTSNRLRENDFIRLLK